MSLEAAESTVLEASIERRVLQKFADACNEVQSHAPVGIGPGGLEAVSVDPPTIHMVAAELPASAFQSYDAIERVVGFPVEWLARVCRHADGETLRLAVDGTAARVVNEHGEYAAPLVEPDGLRAREWPEYDDEIEAEATLTGLQFKRVVVEERPQDAALVEMVAEDGRFSFRYLDQLDDLLESASFGAEDAPDIAIDEPGSALYAPGYVGAIANAIMASPPVTLRFADDFPLCVRYPLSGVWTDDERGHVEHWLAPRIRDGDGS